METVADQVNSVADVERIMRATRSPLLPCGGGSKPALSGARAGATSLAMDGLSGITEYEPSEYTFTALAGTPLAEIEAALAAHGQYLPFDPPSVLQGATLGGTIAAGLSGPRRWRYGGLRDFIIGIRFVDGRGRMVRGGGKVVKNAAGFDFPKLFVGSLGRLGILTEATFKVFPSPPAFATLNAPCIDISAAQALLARIATSALELEAVDVSVHEGGPTLHLRLGGLARALPERMARLRAFVGHGDDVDDDAAFWRDRNAFAWVPPGAALAKVPISPHVLVALDGALAGAGAQRVYSVGGHLAWVGWPHNVTALDTLLHEQGLAGLLLRGDAVSPLLGVRVGATTLERVKGVLDPDRRFLEF